MFCPEYFALVHYINLTDIPFVRHYINSEWKGEMFSIMDAHNGYWQDK